VPEILAGIYIDVELPFWILVVQEGGLGELLLERIECEPLLSLEKVRVRRGFRRVALALLSPDRR